MLLDSAVCDGVGRAEGVPPSLGVALRLEADSRPRQSHFDRERAGKTFKPKHLYWKRMLLFKKTYHYTIRERES